MTAARGSLLVLALACSSGSPGADGGAPADAPPLPAEAPAPARLEVDQAQIELSAAIGQTKWTSVVVWNRGGLDSGRPMITLTDHHFMSVNRTCGEAGIRAGGTCVLDLGFQPTGPETTMETAVIRGTPGGTISLLLIGRALSP